MKKRGICLALLLGILAGLLLTGCGTSQDVPLPVTEATAESATEATIEATTEATTEPTVEAAEPSEAIQEGTAMDIEARAEGYNRISLENPAFQNYEIWQDKEYETQCYLVNLDCIEQVQPFEMYYMHNTYSGQVTPAYAFRLVNQEATGTYPYYWPCFNVSLIDGTSRFAVDFGSKVAGIYGFICDLNIIPYPDESAISEETAWHLISLGSMSAKDPLGYKQVSMTYSEDGSSGHVTEQYLYEEVTNEIAGFVLDTDSSVIFGVNYESVFLIFDSMEHLAEYAIPRWEAFEAN